MLQEIMIMLFFTHQTIKLQHQLTSPQEAVETIKMQLFQPQPAATARAGHKPPRTPREAPRMRLPPLDLPVDFELLSRPSRPARQRGPGDRVAHRREPECCTCARRCARPYTPGSSSCSISAAVGIWPHQPPWESVRPVSARVPLRNRRRTSALYERVHDEPLSAVAIASAARNCEAGGQTPLEANGQLPPPANVARKLEGPYGILYGMDFLRPYSQLVSGAEVPRTATVVRESTHRVQDLMVEQGPSEVARRKKMAAITSACSAIRSLATRSESSPDKAVSSYKLLRALAAQIVTGKTVRLSIIEAAVKRELGVDMAGRLDELEEAILKSQAIYRGAHERMRKSSGHGYVDLLAIPERHDPELCHESDDFETVYAQAAEAQLLLESHIASAWQARSAVVGDELAVPTPGCAEAWVEDAISPGVKGRQRSLEKMSNELGGHANRLRDLARITLTYSDCASMVHAVTVEMASSGMKVGGLRNKFAFPTALGYSDVNATVVVSLADGTRYMTEVQLNHPEMIEAKKEAHGYYVMIRGLLPKLCQGTATDASSLEQALVKKLTEADAPAVTPIALEASVLSQLRRSSLDFAVDDLMAKVDSAADVVFLADRIEKMVEDGREIELDDLAALPIAPGRAQRREQELRAEKMKKEKAALRRPSASSAALLAFINR